MKYLKMSVIMGLISFVGVLGLPEPSMADDEFEAKLNGFSEAPAVSSTGSGKFSAEVSKGQTLIKYKLSYKNLEGTVTNAAHIHLGQPDVNGGVSAFLCGGGGKPACPPSSGKVTGTIIASDVIGPVNQGIAPGELAELLKAMRKDVTYVNVHTDKHPGGEIRGNIEED